MISQVFDQIFTQSAKIYEFVIKDDNLSVQVIMKAHNALSW